MSNVRDSGLTAIRLAPNQGPFTLSPVIGDIFRTRYCCPGSVFLVEDVQRVPISKSGRWHVIQLLLGDGEHCMQGLLSGPIHQFVHNGEIAPGCYVRVDNFTVKWVPVKGDGVEKATTAMVYLTVEHLAIIGWNDVYKALWDEQLGATAASVIELKENETPKLTDYSQFSASRAKPQPPVDKIGASTDGEHDAVEDAFEEPFDNQAPYPFKPPSQKEPKKKKKTVTFSSRPPMTTSNEPVALPRDWHDPQMSLKLTTLRAIPNLPYRQNWSCNVLAIVASLSPVEPSYLPPYRQRTARLSDRSTSKQVHLTVFLDPDEFEPKIGSAVLLVGVKNHMFDGGSLKKYASDKERDGGRRWWFEDPLDLKWCDVQGIKSWWREAERGQA